MFSKKVMSKNIFSGMFTLVLLLGLIAAATLVQQNQDIREHAKTADPPNIGLISPPSSLVPVNQKIMVIAYDTHEDYPNADYTDPLVLSGQLAEGINKASKEKGYDLPNADIQIAESYVYNTPLPPGSNCGSTGPCADFDQIFAAHSVCSKINQGVIDEIWIWTGASETNGGRLNENQIAGQPPYIDTYDTSPIFRSDCNRDLTIMGLNYETGWEQALHSFAHRVEFVVPAVLDAKNIGETGPGDNWYSFDGKIGYNGILRNGNTCGNAHWAPNATSLSDDYDFNLTNEVVSKCNDWNPQLTGQSSVFNCTEWGCGPEGYYTWWLKSMPGLCNSVDMTKLNGQPMPNWWKLILDYEISYNSESCPVPETHPPDCTDFSVPFYHDRGDVLPVSCVASDPDDNIQRVEFYYAKYYDWLGNNCGVNWKLIDIDYTLNPSGRYRVDWDTSLLPLGRYIVIARVYDDTGLGCTGNPGACNLPACSWAAGETTSPTPPEDCYYCDPYNHTCELDASCTIGNMTLNMCEFTCQGSSLNESNQSTLEKK